MYAPHESFGPLAFIHDGVARLKTWTTLLGCFLLGVVANLGFPPFHFWISWVIITPLLVWLLDAAELEEKPLFSAFSRGFMFGFGLYVVSFHWLGNPFFARGGGYIYLAWLGIVGVPAGLALFWGAGFAVGRFIWRASIWRILLFASLFGFTELLRGHLFGGFPWNLPAMIFEPGGAISQWAADIGVYGLSFVTLLIFAAPATLASFEEASLPRRLAAPILASIMLGLFWGLGHIKATTPIPSAPEATINVKMLDAGVPQKRKFDEGVPQHLFWRYLELTKSGDLPPADIVIWPEGATPVNYLSDPNALDAMASYIGGQLLLAGTTRFEGEHAYNTMALLTERSAYRGVNGIYDKYRLVPFGEFMPFAFLGLISQNATGYSPGARPTSLQAEAIPPFIPLICYEALFPLLADREIGDARWIVNISNDSWFGRGIGPKAHFAHARMRAIEEGLPMARVASGGVMALVDAKGRILSISQPDDTDTTLDNDKYGWQGRILQGELPLQLIRTNYRQIGILPLIFTLLLVIVAFFAISNRK